MRYQAAIFDMDGTLLDSSWVWDRVDQQFQQELGVTVREDYGDKIAHMNPTQCAEYTIREYGVAMTAEQLTSMWAAIAADLYAHEVKLKPGAGELLEQLKSDGIQLSLATSCFPSLCAAALKNNGVYGLFDVLHFSDNIGKGKDSADIYIACARDMNAPPKSCAVFEDILKPLDAVKSEGMGFFAVEDVKQSAEVRAQLKCRADCYINDYHRFVQDGGLRYFSKGGRR